MGRMLPVLRLVVLLMLPLPLLAEAESKPLPFPPGDARLCLGREPRLLRFEVLPGTGWDNLQNKESANVVAYNFSLCVTTDDGRFLVPDAVSTVPVKTSSLQAFAELITHWNNFTSTTATSVNVDAGASFSKFSISGKFSSEFSDTKERMLGDKSMTTRVQVRYVRYTARLQPDQPLAPAFRRRLLRIASHLQLNQTEHARYAAQLLVRDFGTHVVTTVDAGAIIAQTDQVKSDYINSKSESKTSIAAAASASFFGVFHIGTSFSHTTDQKAVDEYMSSRTWSKVESEGGPPVTVNMTLKTWSEEVDKDLVAVDRHGDPLWFLVTQQALPELPESLIYDLTKTVREAVDLYYDFNTYRGCTRQDAPNFSAAANVDDGTCKGPLTNLTFGGVFLTCDQSSYDAGDLCGNYRQVNPKTGGYSCPSGYTAVELHASGLQGSRTDRQCSGWWIFKHCHDVTRVSSATVRSHWCAAQGAVTQESGFLFGGLYTSRVVNPLTQDQSCPNLFHPFKFGTGLVVCLSDDYELGYKYSVPFGGFYSCAAGNPLAMNTPDPSPRLKASQYPSLNSFLHQAGPSSWPMHCPQGYSQHLADVETGCSINYCVQSGVLSPTGLPPIKRPPYFTPNLPPSSGDTELLLDARGLDWKTGEAARLYVANHVPPSPSGGGSQDGQMSPGVAAVISIVTTLACVGMVTAIILWRRRRSNTRRLRDDTHPIVTRAEGSYGTIGSEEVAVTVQ